MTHHPTSGVTESGIGQLRPRDLNTSDVFESETFELLRRMSKFVFAGYVTLIDHWLGRLTTMIESLDQPYLLIVTAASGQAFGERDLLLPEGLQNQMATELDDATLHTPLIIRTSQGPRFGTRHAELTQPVDLAPTLLDWFRQSPSRHLDGSSLLHRSGQSDQRERFAYHIGSQGEIGIRDADRLLIAEDAEKLRAQPIEACDHEPIGRLYVKPDDRWQVHDVAQQEPSTQLRLAKQLQTRLKKG